MSLRELIEAIRNLPEDYEVVDDEPGFRIIGVYIDHDRREVMIQRQFEMCHVIEREGQA